MAGGHNRKVKSLLRTSKSMDKSVKMIKSDGQDLLSLLRAIQDIVRLNMAN